MYFEPALITIHPSERCAAGSGSGDGKRRATERRRFDARGCLRRPPDGCARRRARRADVLRNGPWSNSMRLRYGSALLFIWM